MSKNSNDGFESLLASLSAALNPIEALFRKYGAEASPAIYRVQGFMKAKGYLAIGAEYKIGIADEVIYVSSENNQNDPILVVDILNNLVHVDTTGHFGTVRTRDSYIEKQQKLNVMKREVYADEINEAQIWEDIESAKLDASNLDSRLDGFDPTGQLSN